jgi:GntR family transcriptional regulator
MCDLTLHIDLTSETPAYQQIVDGLRALLVVGALKPGFRLPPVRQLATDLTVHHNTVAEAYRILAAEGWLNLRQGRGAAVVDHVLPEASAADEDWLARRIGELAVQGVAKGISRKRIMQLFQQVLRDMTAPAQNKDKGNE